MKDAMFLSCLLTYVKNMIFNLLSRYLVVLIFYLFHFNFFKMVDLNKQLNPQSINFVLICLLHADISSLCCQGIIVTQALLDIFI